MASATAFFEPVLEVAQTPPNRVVMDGLASYPRAIAKVLGEAVIHEPESCLDNPLEPDHRGIQHRYYPMLGFRAFESAKRFCAAFEAARQSLREPKASRTQMAEFGSLTVRLTLFIERVQALEVMFQSA